MKTSDFDYFLPDDLIAQHPADRRDHARMMILDRVTGHIVHSRIADIVTCLRPGDVLVMNDTKVIPARVMGTKKGTRGKVEVLFLRDNGNGTWDALCRMTGRRRVGTVIELAGGCLSAEIVAIGEEGFVTLRVDGDRPVLKVLEEHGMPPLPPYIRRPAGPSSGDRERYQTVYALNDGAVAAPTAGLHFTDELLARIKSAGVQVQFVTLHVGIGTFRPVKVDDPAKHRMDGERYEVLPKAATAINKARQSGGRIVAVGTTTVRTLETVADEQGNVHAGNGISDLFIRQPYRFKAVDAILTNFHLPKSTLLMMISAFASRESILSAYREAVAQQYRFYSFGDCMLLQ